MARLQQNYATYTYTANGKRQTVTDANGNLSTLEYDGLDRLAKLRFPVTTKGAGLSSTSDFELYGYDAAGNRISLRKRDGRVLTYSFDALNRERVKTVPASVSGAPGYSVYRGYDVRGLVTYARFGSDSGPGVTQTYDGFARLRVSSSMLGGVTRKVQNRAMRTDLHFIEGRRTSKRVRNVFDVSNPVRRGSESLTSFNLAGVGSFRLATVETVPTGPAIGKTPTAKSSTTTGP